MKANKFILVPNVSKNVHNDRIRNYFEDDADLYRNKCFLSAGLHSEVYQIIPHSVRRLFVLTSADGGQCATTHRRGSFLQCSDCPGPTVSSAGCPGSSRRRAARAASESETSPRPGSSGTPGSEQHNAMGIVKVFRRASDCGFERRRMSSEPECAAACPRSRARRRRCRSCAPSRSC